MTTNQSTDDLAIYEVRCTTCGNQSSIGFAGSWGPTRWGFTTFIPDNWALCDRPKCAGSLRVLSGGPAGGGCESEGDDLSWCTTHSARWHWADDACTAVMARADA